MFISNFYGCVCTRVCVAIKFFAYKLQTIYSFIIYLFILVIDFRSFFNNYHNYLRGGPRSQIILPNI